jgi:hypothetical protein
MADMRRARRRIFPSLIVAAIVAFATVVARADDAPIAQIKTATAPAFILRGGSKVPAVPGAVLFVKDVLQTDAGGTIGLTFSDNSVLSVGPSSEVALAEYNFDSSNFTGSMQTDIRSGTLSMVSGDIARSSPSAMKVRTPTAILGVRGTSFAVEVGD